VNIASQDTPYFQVYREMLLLLIPESQSFFLKSDERGKLTYEGIYILYGQGSPSLRNGRKPVEKCEEKGG